MLKKAKTHVSYKAGDRLDYKGHFYFTVPKGTVIEMSDPTDPSDQLLKIVLSEDLIATTAGFTHIHSDIVEADEPLKKEEV